MMKETRWTILSKAIKNNERSYRYNGKVYYINNVDRFLDKWSQLIVIAVAMIGYYVVQNILKLDTKVWYNNLILVVIALAIAFGGVTIYLFLYGLYIDLRHRN
jgi:uncharacterized membrane protein